MKNNPLPRLDSTPEIREKLLPFCRLRPGQVWIDPLGKHRVACADAINSGAIKELCNGEKASLAVHDPPYNLVAFEERELSAFIEWCRGWIRC